MRIRDSASLFYLEILRGYKYFKYNLPIFTHRKDDVKTFRMITSQICVNGCAKQSELCRAFGITPISIKRSVKLYRREGTAGFYKERNTRGASVLTQEVLSKAQELLNEGEGISETATKLGIKKDTLCKAVKSGRLQEVKREADCLFELPKVSWRRLSGEMFSRWSQENYIKFATLRLILTMGL